MNKFQGWVGCDISVVITEDDMICVADRATKTSVFLYLDEFKRIVDLLKERGMI